MSESTIESFSNDSESNIYDGPTPTENQPSQQHLSTEPEVVKKALDRALERQTTDIIGHINNFVSNGVGAELKEYHDICYKQDLKGVLVAL